MTVPTNLEYQAFGDNAPLVEIKAKDEENYQYSYFAKAHPSLPIFGENGRVQEGQNRFTIAAKIIPMPYIEP